MGRILGNERQVEYLNTVMERDRLGHAYLFYGPEHVGKLTIAKSFASALHCKNPKKKMMLDGMCGECGDCRAIDADTHPQVILLDPAHTLVSKKDVRKDIPIEDIRELKRAFSLAPEGGKWRIAIINEADTMTGDAADAFLKLLEEPGSQTLLILISSAPDLLPPTLVSRTHAIRFAKVRETDIADFLEREVRDKETARAIAGRSFGCPGLAIRMARDKEYWEEEKKFVSRFSAAFVRKSDILQMFVMSKEAAGDEDSRRKLGEEILRTLHSRMRDPAGREGMAGLAKKIRAGDRIFTLLGTTNVNPRLALDAMSLEYVS